MENLFFFLLICIGTSVALETYYMDSYCGSTISMILEDIDMGRLSLDGSFIGDCNVTIETWYTADRLMFHFENFDIGGIDCDDSYLSVYDGDEPKYDRHVHGLHKVCGASTPSGDYVPSGRYVTFRYVNKKASYNSMDVIFTSFHTGYCYTYEYECSNGRCIDDTVNCNGYNPCNDGSDCELSGGAIAGVIIGAVFGLVVVATVLVLILRKRWIVVQQPTEPQPFQATPATIIHAPATNYGGIASQYQTPTSYNVATSIQQKAT